MTERIRTFTIEMLHETRGACCERSDREEEEGGGGRCVNIVDGIVVVVVDGRRGQQGKEREEVSVIEPLMKKLGGREGGRIQRRGEAEHSSQSVYRLLYEG